MADILSPEERAERMRGIRSKNTKPELIVRARLRFLGLRGYRLHRKDLPGTPDIVFFKRKIAIFVNGCFWHGHACRGKVRLPKSRLYYWLPKIKKNQLRDSDNIKKLRAIGWRVLVIWECETKDLKSLDRVLTKFLK